MLEKNLFGDLTLYMSREYQTSLGKYQRRNFGSGCPGAKMDWVPPDHVVKVRTPEDFRGSQNDQGLTKMN